jgi:hypothetical protein
MKFSAHIELSGVTVLEPMILNEPTNTGLVTVAVAVAVVVAVAVAVVVAVVPQLIETRATAITSARGNKQFLTDLNNFFSLYAIF